MNTRQLPPMPANALHVMRRIRRCENEAAAQVVLEHFAMEHARAAIATSYAAQAPSAYAWQQWIEDEDCAPYWKDCYGTPWWPDAENGAQPQLTKVRNMRPLFEHAAPVAPAAAAPRDTRFTHPGCDACACPPGVCQSEAAQPDERAAFELLRKLKGYLMRVRIGGDDTLASYRRACTEVECEIEEWLNAARATAPQAPERTSGLRIHKHSQPGLTWNIATGAVLNAASGEGNS